MDSEIFVIGGPNGAGKSTTAMALLPERLSIEQFVNADLNAKGLSPFAPEKTAVQAGRLMLHRIHELRDRQESFAFETTLSGRSYVNHRATLLARPAKLRPPLPTAGRYVDTMR